MKDYVVRIVLPDGVHDLDPQTRLLLILMGQAGVIQVHRDDGGGIASTYCRQQVQRVRRGRTRRPKPSTISTSTPCGHLHVQRRHVAREQTQ